MTFTVSGPTFMCDQLIVIHLCHVIPLQGWQHLASTWQTAGRVQSSSQTRCAMVIF